MSKIWPMVPLGEIVKPIQRVEVPVPGTSYRQIGVKLWGEGAYERESIDGGQTRYKTLSCVEADDIIVNKIWARSGSVAVVPESLSGCYGSSEFPTFTPLREKLDPRWFQWLTKTKPFWEQCDEKSRGTSGKNRIRPARFLEIEIPLPPLPEQRRIVARIEELAAKIEEARKIRRQAAAEAEAISTVIATAVFDNPDWPHRTIEELVGRANLKNGKSLKTTTQPSDMRCLTLSALRHGRVNCSDTKPILMTKAEAGSYLVHPGDIFVVRGNGSKELVGRAGMVEGNSEGMIFPDLFIRVPLDQHKVLGSFFVAVWNSKRIRDIIEENAKTTSGIWKINQGHIASTSIPVPRLPEQRHIIAYLDGLQAKVDALKRLQLRDRRRD
jgi:type I restriction enzyme S subunit